MEIKPAYVTFEQAKLLKEKGFNEEVTKYWNEISSIFQIKSPYKWNQANKFLSIPEQWQVIEWLRVKHGIDIHAKRQYERPSMPGEEMKFKWVSMIDYIKSKGPAYMHSFGEFDSPQEAYSAAFDYVLNNLI